MPPIRPHTSVDAPRPHTTRYVSHTTMYLCRILAAAINAADICQKGALRRHTTVCVSYYHISVSRTTKQVAAINAADIC